MDNKNLIQYEEELSLKKRFVSLLTAGLLSICLSACANDAVSTSNMPIGDPIPVSDETSLAERSAVESSIESDENITDLTEESSDTDSDIANIDNSSADDESNHSEKDSATSLKLQHRPYLFLQVLQKTLRHPKRIQRPLKRIQRPPKKIPRLPNLLKKTLYRKNRSRNHPDRLLLHIIKVS